jgi:hypothetical protein
MRSADRLWKDGYVPFRIPAVRGSCAVGRGKDAA